MDQELLNTCLKKTIYTGRVKSMKILLDKGANIKDEYFQHYFRNDYKIPTNCIEVIKCVNAYGYVPPFEIIWSGLRLIFGEDSEGLKYLSAEDINTIIELIHILIKTGSLHNFESFSDYNSSRPYIIRTIREDIITYAALLENTDILETLLDEWKDILINDKIEKENDIKQQEILIQNNSNKHRCIIS